MRRGDDDQSILGFRVPGPPSGLHGTLGRDDDEDEEGDEEGAGEALIEAEPLVEQLRRLEVDGEGRELGVEVIRCVGDEVVSMELVLAGEEARPLPGREAHLSVDEAGRGRLRVGDEGLSVTHLDVEGKERALDGASIELVLERGERALLEVEGRRVLLRTVGEVAPRRWSGPLSWALLGLGALLIAALTLALAALVLR